MEAFQTLLFLQKNVCPLGRKIFFALVLRKVVVQKVLLVDS